MLNAATETALNPPVYNPQPPAKPDQAGRPDDFGALVDSNLNAASSASQFQPPAPPSRQSAPSDNSDNRDDAPPRRTDTDVSSSSQQQNPPPANDVPPASSAGDTPQADSSTPRSKSKDKAAKTDDKTDDSDQSATPDTANQTSDPVAVVVTAAAHVQATVKSAGKDTDTGIVDGDPAQNNNNKGISPQAAAFAADTKTAGANNKPAAAVVLGQTAPDSTKTEDEKVPQVVTSAVVPQVPAGTPTGATAESDLHQTSTGKAGGKGASIQKTAATGQQTAAKTETASQQQDATSAAASNGDADEQSGNEAKPNTLSVKAEATPAAAGAAHAHQGTDTQALKPDTTFQSVLDLQSQPLTQPAQTSNFTVTAAGPAASAQALDAPVPISGLAVDIATKAAAGNTKFQITLDPAELGRIDVRLDVDKHGQVTSHLTVERPATLDMLRNDAPKLQQALEDAGFKTGDGSLQFSLRDQSGQNGNSYNDGGQNRNAQRLIISEDTSTAAQAANTSYGSLRTSRGGVDISI